MTAHVRTRGGATIPVGVTRVTVSRPLAVLTTDDAGVAISLRPVWVARISLGMAALQGAAKSNPRNPVWQASWAELDHVLAGPRSVVLFPTHGRACRFNVRAKHRLEPLLSLLDSRHIPTEQVSSTISWTFKI